MSEPEKPDDMNEPPATEAVLVSEIIPATRERIFAAWMDSDQHSAFTGDRAVIDPMVGGLHSSFDGYASGTTMSLEPFRRIVQTWRSTDFPKASADSLLEITLEETVGGTLLTLLHSEIPTGQSDQCREGWLTLYLEPLKRYFTGRVPNGVHAADKKALAAPRKRASAQRTKAPRAIAAKGLPRTRKAVGRAKAARPAAGGKARPARGKTRPARGTARPEAHATSSHKSRKKTAAKAAVKPTARAAAKRTPAARKRKPATRRTQAAKAGAKRGPATKSARAGKTKRKPRK